MFEEREAATSSRINCSCYEMKCEYLWSKYRNSSCYKHNSNENFHLFGIPKQFNSRGTIYAFHDCQNVLNTFFISLNIFIHEWLYHSRSLTEYQRPHTTPYSIWIKYKYKFLFLQTTIRSKAVDSFSLLGMNYLS